MIDAFLAVPTHLRERLAKALESGQLPVSPSQMAIRSSVGAGDHTAVIVEGLNALQAMGATGALAANYIRSLKQLSGGTSNIDIVWSGPDVPGLYGRDTRRVYEEVIGGAQRSLWITTYAFFDGPKAFAPLAKRMEAVPGLQVRLLLNIGRKWGDTTKADHLVRQFADHFWKIDWPGKSRPSVFYDPRALDLDGPGGVLHAKTVVADEEILFVTSANLTEAALDRNIELGLLARDRGMAVAVSTYLRALIDQQILHALPTE